MRFFSYIKYAVVVCIFVSICPVTDISATMSPIGVKLCNTLEQIVHDISNVSEHKFSLFGGDIFRGHKCETKKGEAVGFLASQPFDHEYLANGTSER